MGKDKKRHADEVREDVFVIDDEEVETSLEEFAESLKKEAKPAEQAEPEKPAVKQENPKTKESEEPEAGSFEEMLRQSAELQQAQQKIAALEEEVRRLVAENRNQKIRLENDFRTKLKYASESFFRDFIVIRDDFEKALSFIPAHETTSEFKPFIDGIRHLDQNTENLLKRFGVESYSAVGSDFDPNLHQAMRMVDVPGKRSNEVVTQFMKGYKYQDRILRPAMVEIATGAGSDTTPPDVAQTTPENSGETTTPQAEKPEETTEKNQ